MTEEKITQQMLQLAIESCPCGMLMIDHDGKLVLINAEVERVFGYQRQDLIGRPVEALVPARFHSEHLRHRTAFDANPETRCMGMGRNMTGLRKDGTEFPLEVGLTSIGTGDELLTLCVIVDASERKRTERLKDEFVSTVSHELRTPLTSISASLGLLVAKKAGDLSESAMRLLVIAQSNCQRLVRLINDILDIEKLDSDGLVFNLARVDIRTAVKQAIESNRGFAEGYRVHLRLDAASADGAVNADPDRLAQVITNLLSNAIKFSPPEEDVLVAIVMNGDNVRISVRDHGAGVPAGFRPHIFEKFAQADASDARQKGGTGLGLSIVKKIIERLGGKVGFDDAPGGGTIFNVTLPVWDAAAGRDLDLEARPDAARILLCEDDRDTATAARERLRPAGFATDFAYTAAAAIACADATEYAAILVDLQLPDGDGISLILNLRAKARYRDTPIVVVSIDPTRGRDDVRSSKLDVLGWLGKPVDFDHLIKVLQTSIGSPPTKKTSRDPRGADRDSTTVLLHDQGG